MGELVLTTFDWVPALPRGYVRDLRVRWALEEAGLPYRIASVPFGNWIWQVKDLDEAVAWVKRCPNPMPGPSEIEIRPLFDMAEFAETLTPEFKEIRGRVREKLSGTLGPAGAFGRLGT